MKKEESKKLIGFGYHPRKDIAPKDGEFSPQGIKVLRDYVRFTIVQGAQHLEASEFARKTPWHDPMLETVLSNIDYSYIDSRPLMPGIPLGPNLRLQMTHEILNYLQLVRELAQAKKHHRMILEEVVQGLEGVNRACTMLRDRPIQFTKERIKQEIREDLGRSLVHDYLVEGERFDAQSYAKERGYDSMSNLVRALKVEHKKEFRESVIKIYETKYRAGEKVNVTELCKSAGISVDAFYKSVREREGSMEEFKHRLNYEAREEILQPIRLHKQRTLRRRLATAAGIAIGLILPSPGDTAYRQPIESPKVAKYIPEGKNEDYVTLAKSNFLQGQNNETR